MQTAFKVLVLTDKGEEKDITAALDDRLLSLKTVDRPALASDEFELVLDDRDGRVHFPRKGVRLDISLGYVGQPLTRIGIYTVDSIRVCGPPQELRIKGRAADLRGTAKSQRHASWEGTTLAAVVRDVAARHGWQAVCKIDQPVERADQLGESDLHFLSRLARQHDATATLKEGRLVVVPRGGKHAMPALALERRDLRRFSFDYPDRSYHGGARASHHDNKTGKRVDVTIPNPDAGEGAAIHADRHVYASAAGATAAAKGHIKRLSRGTAEVLLELPGRADVVAEQTVAVSGIKDEVDGSYLIDLVEHEYTRAGWVTRLEVTAHNKGKAKKGLTDVYIPSPLAK